MSGENLVFRELRGSGEAQKAAYHPRLENSARHKAGVVGNARESMAGKSLIEGVRHILNDSPREAV
jgi:hypothetical protein